MATVVYVSQDINRIIGLLTQPQYFFTILRHPDVSQHYCGYINASQFTAMRVQRDEKFRRLHAVTFVGPSSESLMIGSSWLSANLLNAVPVLDYWIGIDFLGWIEQPPTWNIVDMLDKLNAAVAYHFETASV